MNVQALKWLAVVVVIGGTDACSNFIMPHDTGLSGRTLDLGGFPFLDWQITTVPKGTSTAGSRLMPGKTTPM